MDNQEAFFKSLKCDDVNYGEQHSITILVLLKHFNFLAIIGHLQLVFINFNRKFDIF